MADNNDDKTSRAQLLYALGAFTQIGVTIAACIFIGVMIGRFLDGLLGTSPFLLIFLGLSGAGAGFRSIFEILKRK